MFQNGPSYALAHSLFSPGLLSVNEWLPGLANEPNKVVEIVRSINISTVSVDGLDLSPMMQHEGEHYETTVSHVIDTYEREWQRLLRYLRPFSERLEYSGGYWLMHEPHWPTWIQVRTSSAIDDQHRADAEQFLSWEQLVTIIEAVLREYGLPGSFRGVSAGIDREVWIGELANFLDYSLAHPRHPYLILRRRFVRAFSLLLSELRALRRTNLTTLLNIDMCISSQMVLTDTAGWWRSLQYLLQTLSEPRSRPHELLDRSLTLARQVEAEWAGSTPDTKITALLTSVGSPNCRLFALGVDLPEVSHYSLGLANGEKVDLPFQPWNAAVMIMPEKE